MIGNRVIRLVRGDITAQASQAIVNAANENLVLGAGVAGAIRTRGGPTIQEECDKIGLTPVGSAAITGAGELPADYVIHAVGPRWGEGDEPAKLECAIRSSLELAAEKGLESIALPAVSTGIFGFPVELAAGISIRVAKDHLGSETSLKEVVFCLFDKDTYRYFELALGGAGSGGDRP